MSGERMPFGWAVGLMIVAGLSFESIVERLRQGTLGLWCNGTKVAPLFITDHISFTDAYNTIHIGPRGGIGWEPGAYVFELDRKQVKGLVARAAKPKPEPKPRLKPVGRRRHPGREKILAEYDRLVKEGQSEKAAEAAHAWAGQQVKQGELKSAPPARTIRRWDREREQERN
jgi:hypothetical protein